MVNFWLALSSLALLVGLFIIWWVHSYHDLDVVVTPAAPPLADAPLISVIVPARNEARNIRRCVTALLGQDYANFELLVLDDRSTDATPQILAGLAANDSRLRILHGVELPPGWAGKPHALVQAAAQARGEWLCFVDADTFASPALLSSALAAALQLRADLLTLLTQQELGSFWEKVILPLIFTALSFGFPARRVNDPSKPDAIANGQFIFIRRAVYEAVGGHTAVKERIDEDRALAETVKRAGHRLLIADGRQLLRTRMYTSLPEIWEGWTKNIYLGLRERPGLQLFGALLGLIAALGLPLWLAGGLGWWALGGGLEAAVIAAQAGLLWAFLLYWRWRACRAYAISPRYAFTLPLGALLFSAMLAASAYKVVTGRGVTWKGRRYTSKG